MPWEDKDETQPNTGLGIAGAASPATSRPSPRSGSIPVTAENFTRAESDRYFDNVLKRPGAMIGKFTHNRVPTPIDQQMSFE